MNEKEIIKLLKSYIRKINKKIPGLKINIGKINTLIGEHIGFSINDNIIFYHEDSLCVLIQTKSDDPDDIHEIGLYEIENFI